MQRKYPRLEVQSKWNTESKFVEEYLHVPLLPRILSKFLGCELRGEGIIQRWITCFSCRRSKVQFSSSLVEISQVATKCLCLSP